jgi:chromosome segregation ATPase
MENRQAGLKALKDLIEENFYDPVDRRLSEVDGGLKKETGGLKNDVRNLRDGIRSLGELISTLENKTEEAFAGVSTEVEGFKKASQEMRVELERFRDAERQRFETRQSEARRQSEELLEAHRRTLSSQSQSFRQQREHIEKQKSAILAILERHTEKLEAAQAYLDRLESTQQEHFGIQQGQAEERRTMLEGQTDTLSDQSRVLREQRGLIEEQIAILRAHTYKLNGNATHLRDQRSLIGENSSQIAHHTDRLAQQLDKQGQATASDIASTQTSVHEQIRAAQDDLKSQLEQHATKQTHHTQQQETALRRQVDTKAEQSLQSIKKVKDTLENRVDALEAMIQEQSQRQTRYVIWSTVGAVLFLVLVAGIGLWITAN